MEFYVYSAEDSLGYNSSGMQHGSVIQYCRGNGITVATHFVAGPLRR